MWGGLTPQNSGNPDQLQGLLDAGALGFKCFLSPSGALVQQRLCPAKTPIDSLRSQHVPCTGLGWSRPHWPAIIPAGHKAL